MDAGGGAGASAGQVNERDPFMRDVQAGGGAGGRASLPSPSKSSLSLASLALAGRLPTYTDCAAHAGRDTRAHALWHRQAKGRARHTAYETHAIQRAAPQRGSPRRGPA